ncbi:MULTISPECIES: hypothetical protein [unclassified Mucilaginibacter]|uniref:hypothetical protein n=1 Tax=unclassified Mucilaginibacter TaxID=2617802 RepID=UPI000962FB18|nr:MULTISPECIES: hypothetical protein [unclassified Mucilaginibacter]OJW13325.1 MAG: hypothetical protein BGO48_00780 [Mucilaginibacter sp. 44-25]PLW90120.1 MAG: hypothetical protein C0154_08015 [Mucilaginibacter sp.]
MKKILTIVIMILSVKLCCYGQNKFKIDSVYHILPENKSNFNGSIWKFEYDAPVMYAKLQCPCLDNYGMPVFSYKLTDEKNYFDSKEINKLNVVDVVDLLIRCKNAIVYRDKTAYAFFLLEQVGDKYLIHKANLSKTQIVN